MPELNAEGFEVFFKALWDKTPFAWQHELARRVLEDETPWPEAIALPTAAGKTACLDVAVYALAAQAARSANGQPLSAPRRIFFVVDRRVIVDEAYLRASLLADKLSIAKNGILRVVADNLRQLAGCSIPLACFQLRGGIYRSDAWAKSPLQPAIIASTVDQIGSRLLFRGYGRSFKAWPIQAGLTGNDTLVLLDEAHCSQPFLETLQAIKKFRGWAETTLPSPFHFVVMSATPPPGSTDILHDTSDEPKNPHHPLGKRQLASKPTLLLKVENARGKGANKELAKELAEQAEKLSKDWIGVPATGSNQLALFPSEQPKSAPALVIFCNRVDTARQTHALLSTKYGDKAVLLTGRMRPIDKDDTVAGPLALLSAEHSFERQLDAPLFVVATQTLEVGANLDFDLLVTECASLDALRQRFGRLNRMGRTICARGAILIRADQSETSEDDPVYGEALAKTWLWLHQQVSESGFIDMGIAALQPLLPEDTSELNSQAQHAPVLLPAHLDALVQTAPEPWPTPDVSLFLHGPRSGPADVQICWRADLVGDNENAWEDTVIQCPPAVPETVSVPFAAVRRWLAEESVDAGTDIEGIAMTETPETDNAISRRVICWRGRDDVSVIHDPASIRPGDVVVIPLSLGGWDALATLGSSPIADWGDRAYMQVRDKAIFRIHTDVLSQWQSVSLSSFKDFAESGAERLNDDPDNLRDELKEALRTLANNNEVPKELDWLKSVADKLAHDFTISAHPTGGLLLRGRHHLNQNIVDADTFCDEDDPTASGTTLSLLDAHLNGVAHLAGKFARGCSLSEELAETVESAGQKHDLGKADPRFQAWLKGGNIWLRGSLLAKSGEMAQGRKESESARKRAGYPAGGRHELLSVRLMESCPDMLPKSENLRDLLLHLVASHHGYCRPFAPVVEDEKAVNVKLDFHGQHFAANSETALERLDSGVAERFWKLTRRYGWWGLPWLETMTRLADHRQSEAEERSNE